MRTIILAVFIIIGCTEPMEPTGQSAPTPTAFDRASLIATRVAKQVQRTPVPTPTTAPWIRTRVARQMHPTPTPTIDPNSDFIRDLAERLPRGGHIVEVDFNHSSPRCVGIRNLILSLNPNPPMRSGLGVGTRGEGRGTRRSALDSDKWGLWRPLVVDGGADGGPGQRRWGGVGGTACRGRQSRTGPVRLCGSVE